MKIGAIIIARANVGRFPDKALRKLYGETLLEIAIRKAKSIPGVDEDLVCVATSRLEEDDIIARMAYSHGAMVAYGDADNIRLRQLEAMNALEMDWAIHVSVSMPFFDVPFAGLLCLAMEEHPECDFFHGDRHSAGCCVGQGILLAGSHRREIAKHMDAEKENAIDRLTPTNQWMASMQDRICTLCMPDLGIIERDYLLRPYEIFGLREIVELYVGTPFQLALMQRIAEKLGHIPDKYAEINNLYLTEDHL